MVPLNPNQDGRMVFSGSSPQETNVERSRACRVCLTMGAIPGRIPLAADVRAMCTFQIQLHSRLFRADVWSN
jgi:hypothetical protein